MPKTKNKSRGVSGEAMRYIPPEAKKDLLDGLARLEGHVRAVRRMVEEEQCCDDILLQVAATRAFMTRIAAQLLEQHLADCITTCMEGGPEEIVRRVTRAVGLILKRS